LRNCCYPKWYAGRANHRAGAKAYERRWIELGLRAKK
jgi:hypothetical protein